MPSPTSSISLFPETPLRDALSDARAARHPRELHWLMIASATRLIRAAFPAAAAIEVDVNQFLAGEGSMNLVRVRDRRGTLLWKLSWDDEIPWRTSEGYSWDEVRGEICGDLEEVFYELQFPRELRGWEHVPAPLRIYRHRLADPEVLTGRWRYLPDLAGTGDYAALRDCATCRGTGSRVEAPRSASARCACVRRFD